MTSCPIFFPNYQLAVNYNNAAGLATLEGTLASGASFRFPPVTAFYTYDPGELKVRANGTYYVAGYPSLLWLLTGGIDAVMEKYLRDTYCASGYSGLVTVKTDTEALGTYANYNAVMRLPKRTELNQISGNIFVPYQIMFVRLVAL